MTTTQNPQQQNGSALATAQQGATTMVQARQVSMHLGPQNLEQAWALADALAKSDMVPEQFRNKPANVITVLMMAHDLGVGITYAMREIYVVEGRPTASAALKVSLILQSGLCELWEVAESTDKTCTIRTRRRGKKEASLTLTMDEVKTAGFADSPKGGLKDTWRKFPRIMLRHRVESWLGDQEYPDVVRGLRTPDELGEVVDEAPASPRATVPTQTAAVIPVQPPPNPNALPPLPKVEPHDPVTGEVVDQAPPTASQPATLAERVEQLQQQIAGAKTEAELDALRPEIDKLTPPKNEPTKEQRHALGRAMNAARTALQGRR